MIPVLEQPEPPDFEKKVKRPGGAFLAKVPRPTNKDFNRARYWRESIDDLYDQYGGLCAYSAHWIPRTTGRATVDHFIPKKLDARRAYDWRNFRLCSEKLNNYKGDSNDITDPFGIQSGWFEIDFPACLVKAKANLPLYLKDRVNATIDCLKLNDDDDFVQDRLDILMTYSKDKITFAFLEEKYPFIAYELARQGLRDKIKLMLKMPQHEENDSAST